MFRKIWAFFSKSDKPPPPESQSAQKSATPRPKENAPTAPKQSPTTPPPPSLAPAQASVAPSNSPLHSAPTPATSVQSAFSGEHFEGLGDIWEALLGSTENFIEIVAKFASDYHFPDRPHHLDDEGNLILLTRSPAEGPLAAGVLNTRATGSDELRVRSCYPLLKGYPNRLSILETHTWSNRLEGAVAAQKYPDGPPLDFFAPFYFLDQKIFGWARQEGKPTTTELGAAAFSLRAAEVKEYAVDEGPLYETMLENFLKENPDKRQEDFQNPVISTQGMRMLMPTQYACEWAYRCPVEAVEKLTFENKPFLKLTVPLVGVDESEIRAYLYVSEAELNGYVPQVGEDIEGVLWMSGSVAHETGEETKENEN